jgi:hypothetical protein
LRGWIATFLFVIANVASRSTAAPGPLDVGILPIKAPGNAAQSLLAGQLDASFESLPGNRAPPGFGNYWLKIQRPVSSEPGIAVLVLHASRQTRIDLFEAGATLSSATALAGFRGTQDRVYPVPAGAKTLYAHVEPVAGESRGVGVYASTLSEALERGAEHARMIALTVGALLSMALAALLIWFMLGEPLFILYATLFFLQTLYIAFLSGQGFDWPILAAARPLMSFAWNVPVGLSGVVSCLFTREITDLRRFWPRIYTVFGWLAVLFGFLTVANVAKLFGYGALVNGACGFC